MPMASTRPKSVSVLIEKPSAAKAAKVPMSEIGTTRIGISVARQLCRNRNTTITTSTKASNSVFDNLLQRLGDERRGAVRDRVLHARRKARRLLVHHLLHHLGGVERIGVGLQEDADRDRGHVVVLAVDRVVGGAELDARQVLQAHHLAVAGLADHDVLELGDLGEAALDEHRVLHLLPLRDRRHADVAGRRDHVLLAHDARNVRGGDAEARHPVGVEPDAHAVVARAEDAHLPHAGHARQRVVEIEQRVVAEEYRVVAAARAR